MREKVSRRSFLKRTASLSAGLAAPVFVPAAALGSGWKLSPSERITLGFIGVGGMGSAHLNGFLGNSRVEVVAV